MEPANSLLPILLLPLILDARLGKPVFVSNALADGSSIPKVSALLSMISAELMIPMEPALPATKVMTSSMEPVNSLLLIMLLLLMVDVVIGTGLMESAFLAHKTGFSTQIMFAFLLVILAELMMLLVPVLAATKDMTSSMEPVNSHLQITKDQPW